MKKTLISLLLVLALVLCFALVAAPAADAVVTKTHPHASNHCVCAGLSVGVSDHICDDTDWDPWTPSAETPLPTTGGAYYLTGDVVLGESVRITLPDELVLCLNGYDIIGNHASRSPLIVKNADVTICDCDYTRKSDNTVEFAGTVSSVVNDNGASGGIIYTEAGGSLAIFGGNFQGAPKTKVGSVIYIASNVSVSMYNGVFIGGTAVQNGSSGGNGGCIFVAANTNTAPCGTFNMYGGKLTTDVATHNSYRGGILYSEGAVTISGNAVIENGKANYGGNIYLQKGTFRITGGTISNGVATLTGGNLYNKLTVDVGNNVVISGGQAPTGGNILLHENGVLNLSGNAKIMNGTATTNGGNISVNKATSAFTMTGGAVIGGNISCEANGTIAIKGGFLELAEDFTANIAMTNDLIIDLKGKKLSGSITGNKTLYIADSTAAEAGTEGSGLVASDVLVNFEGRVAQGDALPALAGDLAGQRFVSLGNEAGSLTAHRIYIGVTDVSLVLDGKNVGMGYTTGFKADAAVAEKINAFGIEVYVQGGGHESGEKRGSEFVAGTVGNKVTAHITGILTDGTNTTHVGTDVCAMTYIVIDGTAIYSNEYAFSLQDIFTAMAAKENELPTEAAVLLADIKTLYPSLFN